MAASLWSGLGLVARLGARVTGTLPKAVTGISIDTRSLVPGDLFFAIKGESSDGHDYASQAFAQGAVAAVVDEDHARLYRDAPCLFIVRDVLSALERLGRAARERSEARIVAITGSVGKTSTKEALRLVLSDAAETHASVASYNNHWGVPLTLARMPASARFGIFEIGMNHAREIEPLVTQVEPHIALVTTVGPVHLEHFSGIGEVADAKAEIFSGLVPGGVAIIHRDIDTYPRLRAHAEASPAGHVLTFGASPEADARLDAVEARPEGSIVKATILGRPMDYRLGAPGHHMAMNSLAVLLAAQAAGVDIGSAALSLGRVTPEAGRGARLRLRTRTGDFTLIDESYNANPVSMRAALSLLGATEPAAGGRRIAVLGDMLELGKDEARLHEDLVPDIVAAKVDLLFAAGALSGGLFGKLPPGQRGLWAARASAIEGALAETIRGGDVVMVKGSKGSRMAPLVAALKQRFGGAPTAS